MRALGGMLGGMLGGAAAGMRDGTRAGRQVSSALRDVSTGGAFLRHGSERDDAARELRGLRQDLRQDAAERTELMARIIRGIEKRGEGRPSSGAGLPL